MGSPDPASAAHERTDALAELDAITRRLRRECPWDREQDERSIVPHTVEEAYELADAAQSGDDARLLDELGDVLFQVVFLSLLLEERGAGSLERVAHGVTEKLIRRHPHVFGDASVSGAADVVRNWEQIKQFERGHPRASFEDLPPNLPSLVLARKLRRRLAERPAEKITGPSVAERFARLDASAADEQERFELLGEALFAAALLAAEHDVDAELALRAAVRRRFGPEPPA